MKRFLCTVVLAFSIILGAISANDNDKVITFKELPNPAQEFITKNLADRQVARVEKDAEFLKTEYKVRFSDGLKIEFDKNGAWDKIESKVNPIPAKIVPAQINQYVNANYPNVGIVEIDKDIDDKKVEVKLANKIELVFSLEYQFLYID